MQNRLQHLFAEKTENVLAVYYTAGYPKRDDTLPLLKRLESACADLVEIGMPFSDPLADGPVIQACGQTALDNGMNLELLFEQLKDMRTSVSLPVLLMGYINPVLQFGVERFCIACKNAGIDGVILPDLPVAEYEKHYKTFFESNNIAFVFLISPQTPVTRIREIETLSNGFIYAVSSAATTGSTADFGAAQVSYFEKIASLKLSKPVLTGFGIHDHKTFATVCAYTNGGIIGTAFLRHISENGTSENSVTQFIHAIKQTDYDYSAAP